MPDHQAPIPLSEDEGFRKGARHGAEWFLQTSRTLASEGRTAGEINAYLGELLGVLDAWRAHDAEVPDGNPWNWSFKDLASVLRALRPEAES